MLVWQTSKSTPIMKILVLITLFYQLKSSESLFKGYECSTTKYPYSVQILEIVDFEIVDNEWWFFEGIDKSTVASGTLLKAEWVLTAASGIKTEYGGRDALRVEAMSSNRVADGLLRKIKNYFLHPQFNASARQDDIALLLLESPYENSKGVRFIKLPNGKNTNQLPCEKGLTMGWDPKYDNPYTKEGYHAYSDSLRCAKVVLPSSKECIQLLKRLKKDLNYSNILCTSVKSANPYDKDVGGPLMCDDVQVGIVSSLTFDERNIVYEKQYAYEYEEHPGLKVDKYLEDYEGHPGFYTRVDKYLDFIRKTMADNNVGRTGVDSVSHPIPLVYNYYLSLFSFYVLWSH